MSSRNTDLLRDPWYVLLASGNSTFLVFGVIILTGFSLSIGVAIKDVTASVACAIYQPPRECIGVAEALTGLAIVSIFAIVVAFVIIKAMCAFLLENCRVT